MSTAPAGMLPEVYTWSFPGSPIEIRTQLSVVHEMSRRLGKISDGDGKAQKEGGLLLGRKPRPGITHVTGFCPLPELNASSIEQALAENASAVVGFYRPTASGDLNLSDSDNKLAKQFFTDPGSIVLLIETDGPVAGKAVFAFWAEGALTEFPLMEFPFDGYQLAIAEAERQTPERASVEPPAPIEIEAKAPLPASLPQKPRGFVLVAVIVAAVASAGYFWMHRRPAAAANASKQTAASSPAVPANTLGLAVERRGSDLLLSWDTGSPAIANANFGMLLIRGEGGDRQIALTADQLHSGKVLYTLTSEESEIQLNVINRDKVSRDSVMVVLARKPEDRTGSQARPRPLKERSAQGDTDPSDNTPSQSSSGHEPLKAFTRPTGSRPVAGVASLGEPPSVGLGRTAPVAAGTLTPAVPTIGALPGPPAPAKSTEPRAPARTSEPRSGLAARGPVPLRQPVPKITDQMKAVLSRAASIQLKLSIDAKGRVTKAEPVTPEGVNPLLLEASMEAARFWTFQPATIDNRPIPSEMIVTFHFAAVR